MKRLITLLAAAVITTSIAFGQEFAYQQLTPSRYGGKYGYVDHNGKTVIKHQYDYAENFQSDGVACVTVNGKQGIIDMNGNMLAAPQYSKIYTFNEGLALAYRDGKWRGGDRIQVQAGLQLQQRYRHGPHRRQIRCDNRIGTHGSPLRV